MEAREQLKKLKILFDEFVQVSNYVKELFNSKSNTNGANNPSNVSINNSLNVPTYSPVDLINNDYSTKSNNDMDVGVSNLTQNSKIMNKYVGDTIENNLNQTYEGCDVYSEANMAINNESTAECHTETLKELFNSKSNTNGANNPSNVSINNSLNVPTYSPVDLINNDYSTKSNNDMDVGVSNLTQNSKIMNKYVGDTIENNLNQTYEGCDVYSEANMAINNESTAECHTETLKELFNSKSNTNGANNPSNVSINNSLNVPTYSPVDLINNDYSTKSNNDMDVGVSNLTQNSKIMNKYVGDTIENNLNQTYEGCDVYSEANMAINNESTAECHTETLKELFNSKSNTNGANNPSNVSINNSLNVPTYSPVDLINNDYSTKSNNDMDVGVSNLTQNSKIMNKYVGDTIENNLNQTYEGCDVYSEANMAINNESTAECHTETLKEESITPLRNYYYYLVDENDSYDMLDHTLDSCASLGMREETVEQIHSEIEVNLSEYASPTVGMLGCNLDLCTSNEIDCSEMRKETVHQNRPEAEVDSRDYVMLTKGTISAGVEVDTQQKSSNENEEPCGINVKPRQGCDNTNMFVPTSDMGRYSKKLCCVYCLKRYSKLARHLTTVHKKEVDVQKFQALPSGSKERRAGIRKIRDLGRLEWNTNGEINGGELSTSRRPNKRLQKKAIDYKTCAQCFGTYSSTVLRYHWNKCTNNSLPGERIVKELGRAVEGRLHVEACEDLRTIIFPAMREKEASLSIRYDWIVILFGNDLCLNYSPHFQQAMIRTKLRSAGKLLVASRSICPEITDFASLYQVKNCNTVIEAIRKVAGFDSKLKTIRSPGTVTSLVTLVNTIGDLLIIEFMKLDDETKEKTVYRFLKVFKKEAKKKLNKMVAVVQAKARREKNDNLPSTEDVCRLASFLDSERKACFIELAEQYSYGSWLYLSQLTLMSVLVYNRKRVGDTQNILVSDFQRRSIITQHNDKDAIPEETKELVKSHVNVRGKLYRAVPALILHHEDECLELLVRYRKDAGVPEKNDFLFGLPSKSGKIKTIDACALFRAYSELCGANTPSSLRGTKLRKHFASLCATMNLTDNQVTNVATFMGHDDAIHRNVYRHNPLQAEVVQMSNLLEVARGRKTKSNTANDTDGQISISNSKETKQKEEKKQAIKRPRKQKQIKNSSNNEAKVVKRKIASKPYLRK